MGTRDSEGEVTVVVDMADLVENSLGLVPLSTAVDALQVSLERYADLLIGSPCIPISAIVRTQK